MIAGENSGDLHASNVVKRIKKIDPSIEFHGLGGPQMKQAGVQLRANMVEKLAIIGISRVISNFERVWRIFRRTRHFLETHPPDLLILIDYPGFNLDLIAPAAHKLGIPIIYYITPQVWAWRKKRIYKIKKYIRKALVVFPFEEKMYKDIGVDCTYVGHPLLDVMILTMTREQVFEKFGFDPNKKLIGLLPGSRKSEVMKILPVMLEAAEIIANQMKDVQFVIPRASSISQDLIQKYLDETSVPVKVVDQFRYNVRSALDFVMVASGTATLETALLVCPMVILYKVSFLSWAIGKTFVNIPYIGLANIIAGDMVVPELLQTECTGQNVANKVLNILRTPDELENVRYQLQKVKDKIGGPGASKRAAEEILAILNARQK